MGTKRSTAWMAGCLVAAAAGAWGASCLSLPTVDEFASGAAGDPNRDGAAGDASSDPDVLSTSEAADQGALDTDGKQDSASLDADSSDAQGSDSDADAGEADGTSGTAQIGEPCTSTAECVGTLFCLPSDASTFQGTCTMPCCTSISCPQDFVCYPQMGGSVCVPAAKLGLQPGDHSAATACSTPSECRSGRCENNLCVDTCCSDSNCGSAGVCAVVRVNNVPAWQCAQWNSGHTMNGGDTCSVDDDCRSDYCRFFLGGNVCSAPCCGASACASNTHCTYMTDGASVLRQCTNSILSSAKPCCTSSDCSAGKQCVPLEDLVPNGTLTTKAWVLACQ